MARSEDWSRIQHQLNAHGLLAAADIQEVASDDDITPSLRDAILSLGGPAMDEIHFIDIDTLDWIAEALSSRFCGVPDASGQLDPLTFGSPGGRWRRSALTVSIDATGCNFFGIPGLPFSPPALAVIINAFQSWATASAFFTFNFVPPGTAADIRAVFVAGDAFEPGSRAVAAASYPEHGRIQFNGSVAWSQVGLSGTTNLFVVAIHEIGHALGLSHSSQRGGTMYPYATPSPIIDDESRSAINLMYGWTPQRRLPDRGTSDRAAIGVTSNTNFPGTIYIPRMLWKGVHGDSGLYESELLGEWTPQRRIPAVGSSHSPSVAPIPAPGAGLRNGLMMACKGIPGDQGLYWLRDLGTGWEPHHRIPSAGSSCRPAIANVNGNICMACKGIQDDPGIYWSMFDGVQTWAPFQRVRGVGTTDSPALASISNKLYMFWKGIEGDSNAYWSVIDFDSDPIWRPQRRIEYFDYQIEGGIPRAIGTTGGLSATRRGDSILVAWKGAEGDSGIYVSLFGGAEFGGQIRIAGVGTSVGPSVADVDGITMMAWQGIEGDRTIYWSQR